MDEASSETGAFALHCMGWGVMVYDCSHSIRCSHRSVIHQLDQQAAAAAAAIIVILLRPHTSMHDGVWLDPCGFTVSCQTCTLAGSTGPLGPVLPGACAIEKKREKRERLLVALPACGQLLFSHENRGHRWSRAEGGSDTGRDWGCARRTRKAKNSAPSRLAPLLSQPKIASVNLQQFEWPGTGPLAHRLPPSPLPAAHQEV